MEATTDIHSTFKFDLVGSWTVKSLIQTPTFHKLYRHDGAGRGKLLLTCPTLQTWLHK